MNGHFWKRKKNITKYASCVALCFSTTAYIINVICFVDTILHFLSSSIFYLSYLSKCYSYSDNRRYQDKKKWKTDMQVLRVLPVSIHEWDQIIIYAFVPIWTNAWMNIDVFNFVKFLYFDHSTLIGKPFFFYLIDCDPMLSFLFFNNRIIWLLFELYYEMRGCQKFTWRKITILVFVPRCKDWFRSWTILSAFSHNCMSNYNTRTT